MHYIHSHHQMYACGVWDTYAGFATCPYAHRGTDWTAWSNMGDLPGKAVLLSPPLHFDLQQSIWSILVLLPDSHHDVDNPDKRMFNCISLGARLRQTTGSNGGTPLATS
eukprot:GHVU01073073.1.p1 GENE.GHVU01073073.1~~GHVU01073073.1.p1  ORF type:complete len:109 (+),score=1.87 GHVU01073073.1:196-522(+)